jgi:hypothetical protein
MLSALLLALATPSAWADEVTLSVNLSRLQECAAWAVGDPDPSESCQWMIDNGLTRDMLDSCTAYVRGDFQNWWMESVVPMEQAGDDPNNFEATVEWGLDDVNMDGVIHYQFQLCKGSEGVYVQPSLDAHPQTLTFLRPLVPRGILYESFAYNPMGNTRCALLSEDMDPDGNLYQNRVWDPEADGSTVFNTYYFSECDFVEVKAEAGDSTVIVIAAVGVAVLLLGLLGMMRWKQANMQKTMEQQRAISKSLAKKAENQKREVSVQRRELENLVAEINKSPFVRSTSDA